MKKPKDPSEFPSIASSFLKIKAIFNQNRFLFEKLDSPSQFESSKTLLFSQSQKKTFIRRKLKTESDFFEIRGGRREVESRRREKEIGETGLSGAVGGEEVGEIGWEGRTGVATEEADEEPPEVRRIGEAEKRGNEGGQRVVGIEKRENLSRMTMGEGKFLKFKGERRIGKGIVGFRKELGDYHIEAKKINIMNALPKIVGLAGRSFYSGGGRGWRGEHENFGIAFKKGNQLRKEVRSEMQEEGKRKKTERSDKTERFINSIPLKTWEFWEEGRGRREEGRGRREEGIGRIEGRRKEGSRMEIVGREEGKRKETEGKEERKSFVFSDEEDDDLEFYMRKIKEKYG